MKTKMRWMAGLAAMLLLAVAACEQAPVHPDASPSLNRRSEVGEDTVGTGYFGSGHTELPVDSAKGDGTQN